MDGGYHGELSRYHLFLVMAVTCRLILNQTLWIYRLTVLVWLQKKSKSSVHIVLPQQRSKDNTAVGLFCPFLVVLLLDCPLSTNKQARPKVHLWFTRNANTQLALHRLTRANSSLEKEHTSPTSLCFYWWNIPLLMFFNSEIHLQPVGELPRKEKNLYFNPFAFSTFQTSTSLKERKKRSSGEPAHRNLKKALMRFHKAFQYALRKSKKLYGNGIIRKQLPLISSKI